MTELALPNRPFFAKMTRPRRFFGWLASDLRAALALVVVIVAAFRYLSADYQPPSKAAFIVPSQSVRW